MLNIYDVTQAKDITSKTILRKVREAISTNSKTFKTSYGIFTIGRKVNNCIYVTSKRFITPKFKKGYK